MKDLERRVAALEKRGRETAAAAATSGDSVTPEKAERIYARFAIEGVQLAAARTGPPRPKAWDALYRDLCDGKPVDDRF
jgi:hypothetical protein